MPQTLAPSDAPAEAARALAAVRLARAAELARAGDLAAAAALATEARTGADSPEALDLLARIRAQQGRRPDADALWTELLRRDPTHCGATAGLRRLAQPPKLYWRFAAAAVLLILLLAFGLWPRPTARPGPLAPPGVAPPPSPVRAAPLSSASLQVPGAVVSEAAGARVIRFPEGLFGRGVELHPGARAALVALGRQLATAHGTAEVTVTGFADERTLRPGAAWRDNTALALARAGVALDALREGGHFAAEAVALRAAPDPPREVEPDDRRLHLAARRTVEIRLGGGGPGLDPGAGTRR